MIVLSDKGAYSSAINCAISLACVCGRFWAPPHTTNEPGPVAEPEPEQLVESDQLLDQNLNQVSPS